MARVRSTTLVALLVAGAVIASAYGPRDTARAADACVRAGDRTLARNAHVVVVYRRDRNTTLACDRRRGQRTRIDGFESTVTERRLWVGGPFVLYEEDGVDGLTFYTNLNLFDVSDGWHGRAVGLAGTESKGSGRFVRDGVVDPDGNVAAILAPRYEPTRVIVCPYRGCGDTDSPHPQIVDSGPIEPSSLERRGRDVYWRSGGELRTARLSG